MVIVKQCFTYILLLALPLVTAWAILLSRHYLAFAEKPVKADVIVLFVGPDWGARQHEAYRLMRDGYARYVIIPAYNRLSSVAKVDEFRPIEKDLFPGNSASLLKKLHNYPDYYEDTHFEVLEAKRIMSKLGFRSAIFVSSAYHMRRIKLITSRVFRNEQATVAFVPAQYEQTPAGVWSFERYGRNWWVGNELPKIAWFLVYESLPWGASAGRQ